MTASKDPRFAITARISRQMSEKLDILHFHLMKHGAHNNGGGINSSEVNSRATLVYGAAQRIYNDLLTLLDDKAWEDIMTFAETAFNTNFLKRISLN